MVKVNAQQYLLNNYATYEEHVNLDYSSPDATFKLITKEYDTEDPNLLKDNQVLIQALYFSNDPAQKGWFTPYKSYVDPTDLGSVAPARGIAKVLKSKSAKFKEGDFLQGPIGWSTYNVIDVTAVSIPVDPKKVSSLSQYLSVFGTTTITAYLAAFKYSHVKPEDEGKIWLVTGAAGAVGSALIQILSNLFKPKKIVAIAGGEEKRKYVETLGDRVVGVDYRSSSYKEDFIKALNGEEIDVFVDQVGGEILNHAISFVKVKGRVLQIGAISRYNSSEPFIFSNYNSIITKSITIEGFVILHDVADFPKVYQDLFSFFGSGKLNIKNFRETVVDATGDDFKKVPELWTGLFSGKNTGKYITKVAEYKS